MLVWTNRVYSKNFVTDFLQTMKNIIGGRLRAYEKMIDICIADTNNEFIDKYPNAKNIRVDIEQLDRGTVMVVITGEIDGFN